jgi:hypothetical protein
MSKKLTELPLATSLADTDELYVVQGGVSKRVPKSLVGGGGGGVWLKWNGVDTTQFEASPAFIAPGWSAPSLSVVADADAPAGAVLRLQVTVTAGNGSLFWLLNDTPPWDTTGANRSMIYQIQTQVAVATSAIGFAFLCDDVGTFHGHSFTHSVGNDIVARVDADVEATAVVATSTSSGPAHWRDTLHAGKVAAQPPGYIFHTTSSTQSGTTLSSYGDSLSIVAAQPSSWDNLACDRVGIAVFANTSTTLTFDFNAVSFSVVKE